MSRTTPVFHGKVIVTGELKVLTGLESAPQLRA
jgi:hypothetical protein